MIALDRIRVEFDPAVLEEGAERGPVFERVLDGAGRVELARQILQLLAQPWLHRRDDRQRVRSACGKARLGGPAADLGLDRVEGGDAP